MLHKIKTVTEKVLGSGKIIYQVLLEDGQSGSSWDEEFKGADGKELDFDIAPNQKNSQYLDFKIKKSKPAFGGGGPKNYKPEALSCAINWCLTKEKAATTADVLKVADVFHTWIKGS